MGADRLKLHAVVVVQGQTVGAKEQEARGPREQAVAAGRPRGLVGVAHPCVEAAAAAPNRFARVAVGAELLWREALEVPKQQLAELHQFVEEGVAQPWNVGSTNNEE